MGKNSKKPEKAPENTTVFVSGLPYAATFEEVRDFFADCGEITNLKLPTFQDTGRLLGYGFLTFSSKESTEKALAKNKALMQNRYLDVQLSKGENAKISVSSGMVPEGCRTVFVKGFSYDLSEDQLGDLFRSCGEIVNVRIVYNTKHKFSKGFGYIDFKHEESVRKAVELNNKDYEAGKARKGFKINMKEEGNSKYNKEKEIIMKKKIKKEKKEEKKFVKIKDMKKEKKLSLFD